MRVTSKGDRNVYKRKCRHESDLFHIMIRKLISISLHMNKTFRGKKVNLRLGFLFFLLRNLCRFVHFGVHHPIPQTMLHAEFLLSLLWPKPTQMYIHEHWCFLLLTSQSHFLYLKKESGEASLKLCQLALLKCFWEWNQTPSISNITINYIDPAAVHRLAILPKMQIWTVLAFLLLLTIQRSMDLTSCFGQEQEIRWIWDFTFIQLFFLTITTYITDCQ